MKNIRNFLKKSNFFFSNTFTKAEVLFSRQYFLENYKKAIEKTGFSQIKLGKSPTFYIFREIKKMKKPNSLEYHLVLFCKKENFPDQRKFRNSYCLRIHPI